MIKEYHCPETLEEALKLLARPSPLTIPMGGGTSISRNISGDVAVVDLQRLGLDQIIRNSNTLEIGGAATMQSLIDHKDVPTALREVIRVEWSANQRKQATLAGAIVSCDGRSGLVTGLLALNCFITWQPGDQEVPLGDYLALRKSWNPGRLIQKIKVPLNGVLKLEWISRTPDDLPIVCAGVCQWVSGRTRVALGGYGPAPILAMDGPEPAGAEAAARDAFANAEDDWASAEYRAAMAGVLVRRLLSQAKD